MTEELWPGQRVSRASYVVSMLQPKVVADLELTKFGYDPIPLDPEFATFAADGRPILLPNDEQGHLRAGRARLAQGRRRAGALQRAVREGRALPQAADAAPAAGGGLQAARRRLRAAARGRPRGGHEPPRPDRHLPAHDDVGRRPARRLLRDRRAQGRLRLQRRRRRVGRARTRRGPPTTCCTTRSARSTACRAPGATCAAAWARSPRRSPPARAPPGRRSAPARRWPRSTSRAGASPGSRSSAARRCSAPLVMSGAHPKRTVLDLVGAEHFPDEVAQDMRRYRTRGASVKINAVLSEPPRYVNASADVSEQLLHASVAICPSIPYLERAWQDAQRGVPAEGPYIEVEVPTAVDPSLTDDGTTVLTMFTQFGPARRRGLARRRPRGLRAALLRAAGPARAQRARRDPALRGAGAARPRADLRAGGRLDLPGRAGPRPDGVHAPDAASSRATPRRCTASTCAGPAPTRAAGSSRPRATTPRTASCATCARSAPARACAIP